MTGKVLIGENTHTVECAICGKRMRTTGRYYFRHCGAMQSIAEQLIYTHKSLKKHLKRKVVAVGELKEELTIGELINGEETITNQR